MNKNFDNHQQELDNDNDLEGEPEEEGEELSDNGSNF
jgi:hypothetical protein